MYVALQALNVTQRVEAEIALRHSEQQLLLARSRLEFLSTHDTLTGLGNRLLLDQVFRDTAHDPAASVAVMCLDLDGFKRVNDKHGHGAGDGLLVEVARRIAAAVGPTDTAIRFGGDEFVVVMPNQTFEVAERVCEAVLQAVAQPYSINGVNLRVGSSAGMVLTPAVPSWQAAVEQADRLLYQAKSDPAARLRTRNDLAP